jgi:type II secretory pathway component PulF
MIASTGGERNMATELEQMKENIEEGDSCIEAFEQVDLIKMVKEGNDDVALKINQVLALTGQILEAAGVK